MTIYVISDKSGRSFQEYYQTQEAAQARVLELRSLVLAVRSLGFIIDTRPEDIEVRAREVLA